MNKLPVIILVNALAIAIHLWALFFGNPQGTWLYAGGVLLSTAYIVFAVWRATG